MSTAKASLILVALVAGVALAQAAGGIKGHRFDDSQQHFHGLKAPLRPQPQQQYLPPPPPPPPQAPRPVPIQAINGPGKIAPVFTAVRVQPMQQLPLGPPAQPLPLPPPAPLAPPAPLVPPQPLAVAQPVQQQVAIQEQEVEQVPQPQQLDTEIDPNAAAQEGVAPALAVPVGPAPAAAAVSVTEEEIINPRPEPYSFNYGYDSSDGITSGSSTREEQQDASGRVTGFYTLKGEDGRDRRVDYIADANGFRATISTNEMGTSAKDSADVNWQAQPPTDAQLRVAESATQAARQRVLLNPQPLASGSAQISKISSPRQNAVVAVEQRESVAARAPQVVAQPAIAQLQEPFEQIRQTELKARRARQTRHAPFYLYTV